MMFRKIHSYGLILVFIFLSNFIWEISQMFLYTTHTDGLLDVILVHLKATLGDMALFLVIYVLGMVVFQNCHWAVGNNKARYIFVILVGAVISVLVEKVALLSGRWSYNQLMPIIPILNVGLMPVLQMIVFPTTAVLLWERLVDKY